MADARSPGSPLYEELDFAETSLGDLELRRRKALSLGGIDVFEVKLDGAFLMSSLHRASEEALATATLPRLAGRTPCDVLVGGLGLGYSAQAALDLPGVTTVTVAELLPEVIAWHERGILPLGRSLPDDPRCTLLQTDFFQMFATNPNEPHAARQSFDAILLDIDHAPDEWLDAENATFYNAANLGLVRDHLRPGGLFGIWSSGALDEAFLQTLSQVFDATDVVEVPFENLLLDEDELNLIYVGTRANDQDTPGTNS